MNVRKILSALVISVSLLTLSGCICFSFDDGLQFGDSCDAEEAAGDAQE